MSCRVVVGSRIPAESARFDLAFDLHLRLLSSRGLVSPTRWIGLRRLHNATRKTEEKGIIALHAAVVWPWSVWPWSMSLGGSSPSGRGAETAWLCRVLTGLGRKGFELGRVASLGAEKLGVG
jgi:hypothetical protein